MKKFLYLWLAFVGLFVGATACQVLPEPPRLATATAQAELPPTATLAPLQMPVENDETAVVNATRPPLTGQPNPILTVWVNETSAAHREAVEAIAAGFEAAQGVDVEVMYVAPNLLPDLVETAAMTDTYDLPDVIVHPLEYSVGWAERGIFSSAAAETAVANLGPETFNQAALALVEFDGQVAAVPSDGYQQILIYRTDWFNERGLDTPDNYADMLAAAEAIYDRENLRSGFVIPTESNLRTTHEAFEHLAAANGCQLIDAAGEVLLPEPACKEAIDFYYNIVHQYSPIGVQTDTSARNAYLAGRTGMIMAPPTILPQLAGLDPANLPTCPACAANPQHLAENSGIITTLFGNGETSANFGKLTNIGITSGADVETAVAFIEYWFTDGYETWLGVESERKVPMRQGVPGDPDRYLDNWGTEPLADGQPSLVDIYGPEVVAQLKNGVAQSDRWGFAQGQGGLITELYRELTFSVVLQEMLSGYFDTDKTIYELYERVLTLIPNYEFEVKAAPTPTPEPDE